LVLDKLVSPKKSSFMPGKHIVDGIIVAHEVIHSISTGKRSAMLLNLDQFIEDTFLVGEASMREARVMKHVLDTY
jgi:hypothetical protein